jgi:primosomal protein N' (replication factor Y)
MVTKGHDFPKVTLVGVLNADQSLYLNDYRANERTFSLLTQVIGRAGRGDQHGRALIQTYQPDHPVLRLAAEQDYEAFYEKEIALRRATVFPPFCDLVSLTCSGKTEVEVMEVARHLLAYMKELIAGEYAAVKVVIYGPQEAPVYKMNDKYRLRFILKCKMNAATRNWMHLLLIRAGALTKKVSVSVDVNPNHS